MNYKTIKLIPIILFALLVGIPYIIYEPFNSLAILISLVFTLLLIKWYEHFDKKDKARTDMLYYAGKKMHIKLTKTIYEDGSESIETYLNHIPFQKVKQEFEQEVEIDETKWIPIR